MGLSAPPRGVPSTATFVPGGDSFADLEEVNEHRADKRSYLRISVPFVIFEFTGVMLNRVAYRSLSINRRSWSMGRCLIFNSDGPVPGVWVWSLADERVAIEAARGGEPDV